MMWMLKLYPRQWRNRYEDEVTEVLMQHDVTVRTAISLLFGALDAHLNYEYESIRNGVNMMVEKLKRSTVLAFCAFMIYGVGFSLLQRLPDPTNTYQAAAQQYPAFNVLYDSNFIVGCIGFFVFLGVGLPLTYAAVKRAFVNRQKEVLRPFSVAVLFLLLFAAATGTVALWHPQVHVYSYLIGYLVLTAMLLIGGTVAQALVVKRSEYKMKELQLLFIPKVVILAGMTASVLLSVGLIAAVKLNAGQLFQSQDVGWPMAVIAIVLMAIGTGLGWIAIKSGRLTDQSRGSMGSLS
ncbi:hypothetical protein [Alicyclobacillus sp. SO9]|uniref:hypothetical protein n=1 Tax=Alicyclobacillus sp. SO9 TaxID=2665646 RepID=UPI0018E82995|nr:hypothetical protein [Alicyclobacillus sp. SO9]QQE78710.1 hypothetical protein GI364_23135 [Alicyclobacillus sp. SO9]